MDLSFAGVKQLTIIINNKPIMNSEDNSHIFILRRAPGNLHYNFSQDIHFFNIQKLSSPIEENSINTNCSLNHKSMNDEDYYECPTLPQGFVFQILIFSTYGDPYYVGLNGIQAYDEKGKKIHLNLNSKYNFFVSIPAYLLIIIICFKAKVKENYMDFLLPWPSN